MYHLGLNVFHADSSACLLKDGVIVCATEEERFTRKKHWAGIPLESIKFCLETAEIKIQNIDSISIGRDPAAKRYEKIKFLITKPKLSWPMLRSRISNKSDLESLEEVITSRFGYCPPIKYVEHHRAHLGSAFYASPYKESAVVSIDGSGDFSTVMIGLGKGNKIQVLESQDFPISVGLLYTAFTQYLGFPYYGDEYKVMGLSPYGHPIYVDQIRAIMCIGDTEILKADLSYFNFNKGVIEYLDNIPTVHEIFNKEKFEKVFGPSRQPKSELTQKHKDIAKSLQIVTEELIFGVLQRAYKLTGSTNICIAGGVAQNSVANGKILQNTSFESLYIPSAGHDAGISMGTAMWTYFNEVGTERNQAVFDANLGISYSNEQVQNILDNLGLKAEMLEDDILFKTVAEYLANGKVVGFFDGQAEFGPRALGSRSILADPRNKNAKELLNAKIKKRESFRPFAPSILEEYGAEYFENYQFTPFMERVLPIREEKREGIPSVTHADGSGRLQSVSKELRPRYHRLISEFYKITGVPILINTSFNENEPVVNAPEHAIDTFLRTDLDVLVIENYVLTK